jgi:phage tail-like protein
VLKRGIANRPDLWAWFDQVRQGTIDRRTVVVTLLNEERNPVMVWKLRKCLPIKWVGPTLSAGESDVANRGDRARGRGAGDRTGVTGPV